MLKIAVCDDEKAFIHTISELIRQRFKNQTVRLDTFTDPHDLLRSSELYDLIFLDIDMPQMTGIELAKQYEEHNIAIVFVTNKEALVFEAYNTTNTFGFIRKSNLKNDFAGIMQRFIRNSQRINYLSVKSNDSIVKIKFSDICYIEKQINSVIIHTKNNSYKEPNTLSNLEKMLNSFGFIRTHIGYLVNLDYVAAINVKEVVLSDGQKIPVSRNKLKSVKIEFLKRSVSVNE
ncbi:MAG: response regulator transcription factor [Clostridia bacterium]|nr:response regulator transcription factor [Clostridia bacterium]MBR2176289.1 response regulator transcription factor [Clostridia bacterium]